MEAVLIVPILFLLMALFLHWALLLRDDIRDAAEQRGAVRGRGSGAVMGGMPEAQGEETWFLYGGPPARRIRDADVLVDFGYAIKERLPAWFQTGND